jgi:hypothetical protein
MYSFKEFGPYHYNEMPQNNPIRWQVFTRTGDVFTPQTGKFMCKDYLNDVCAKYNGKNVYAYGLKNHDMVLNDDGIWLQLTGITEPEVFMHNLTCCINDENPEYPLTFEEYQGTMLVFVPRYYFNQTYLVSLLSYIIRISNGDKKFKSFKDALTSKACQADPALYGKGIQLALSWRFHVPEAFQKYWSYYTDTYNSVLDNYEGSTIHNNGIMAWSENMTIEQKEEEHAL